MDEHVSLYMSPINIDPEQPAMPISHPPYYATYLAKRIGTFCDARPGRGHLGAQRRRHRRRGRFCSRPTTSTASARRCSSPRSIGCGAGTLVCVFDATDRIQHMFWRDLEAGHPAGAGRDTPSTATRSATSTSTTTRWSAGCWSSCGDGDVLMVHLGSRLHLVPPRRQPQQLAAARGLPRAEARRRRHEPSGCATWTGRGRAPTRSG